tara:strand:- start:50 stop:241 length:192 start_codon:yes stop_codon:yes gene_type:complete
MRTRSERRMLHTTEKRKSNNIASSRQNASYNRNIRGKVYSVTKQNGQEYYQELKTRKQVEKES